MALFFVYMDSNLRLKLDKCNRKVAKRKSERGSVKAEKR